MAAAIIFFVDNLFSATNNVSANDLGLRSTGLGRRWMFKSGVLLVLKLKVKVGMRKIGCIVIVS